MFIRRQFQWGAAAIANLLSFWTLRVMLWIKEDLWREQWLFMDYMLKIRMSKREDIQKNWGFLFIHIKEKYSWNGQKSCILPHFYIQHNSPSPVYMLLFDCVLTYDVLQLLYMYDFFFFLQTREILAIFSVRFSAKYNARYTADFIKADWILWKNYIMI